MKQKTGKLTVITVLLLTVCIAAGAMGLPRLLGESFSYHGSSGKGGR